jgi:hypothetical protein
MNLTSKYREQYRATAALLKFCQDHDRSEGSYIKSIELCKNSLEKEDVNTALQHYQDVPLGGNGTFLDWFPRAKYPNETDDYANQVFLALASRWSKLMDLMERFHGQT